MSKKHLSFAVALAAASLALAACGSSVGASSSYGDGAATLVAHHTKKPVHKKPAPKKAAVSLTTGKTGLGTIVTDGKGRTLYVYDEDHQGTKMSACTGSCLGIWPPAEATGKVTVRGVTGKVATIAAPGGGRQLTLNGWPLYYYAGDSKPGQTSGQGVQGIWWVVSPAGTRIGASTSSAGSSSAGPSSPSSGGTGGGDTGW